MGSNQSTEGKSYDQAEVLPSVVTTPQKKWGPRIDSVLDEGEGWFEHSKVVVEPISGVPGAFVLKNLVSEEECDALLAGIQDFISEQSQREQQQSEASAEQLQKDSLSFQPVFFRSWASGSEAEKEKERSAISQRMIAKVDKVSDHLFSRMRPFLPAEESSENSKERQRWTLHSMSKRLRFVRSATGQHFPRHTDGSESIGEDQKTFHSAVIYLNSGGGKDYLGGELTMYHFAPIDHPMKMQAGESPTWTVAASITPSKGDVVVFPHGSFHEAMQVTSGIKYLVRIDPIYQKAESTPLEIESSSQ